MNLPQYIAKVGDKQFAERFNVTERAAMAWRLGTRRPRPEKAQEIIESTPVTWAGIYGGEVKAAPLVERSLV